jgi:hypothetical protein
MFKYYLDELLASKVLQIHTQFPFEFRSFFSPLTVTRILSVVDRPVAVLK